MSTRTFNLVASIVGGVSAIATAVVVYFNPTNAEAITASIEVASVAIVTICANFLNKNQLK